MMVEPIYGEDANALYRGRTCAGEEPADVPGGGNRPAEQPGPRALARPPARAGRHGRELERHRLSARRVLVGRGAGGQLAGLGTGAGGGGGRCRGRGGGVADRQERRDLLRPFTG